MSKKAIKLHPGRRKKHGGYTYLNTGKLPKGRREVERYLTAVREGLIRDIGPTEKDLTTAQLILCDRVVTKLGVIRCIEEHIRENSVFRGNRLSESLRESYITYNESVRRDLKELGINKRQSDQVVSLRDYGEKTYGKKEEGTE